MGAALKRQSADSAHAAGRYGGHGGELRTKQSRSEGDAVVCGRFALGRIRKHVRYEHRIRGGEIYFLLWNDGGAGQCGVWKRLADGGSSHLVYPQNGQWLTAEAGVYHASAGCAGDERAQHSAASAGPYQLG